MVSLLNSVILEHLKITKFSEGLNRNEDDNETNEVAEMVPNSNLGTLLEAIGNPDGYELNAQDSSYLNGWKHALMAIQGKT